MVRLISYVDGPAPFYVDETDITIQGGPDYSHDLFKHVLVQRPNYGSRGVTISTYTTIDEDKTDVMLNSHNGGLVDGFRLEPDLPYSLVFGKDSDSPTIDGTAKLEQPIPLGAIPFSRLIVRAVRGEYKGAIRVHMRICYCERALTEHLAREMVSIIAGGVPYTICNGTICKISPHALRIRELYSRITDKAVGETTAAELSQLCTCRCPVHGCRS